VTKVELFEIIRRDHHVYGKSIRTIAEERSVHRRTVRQALANAIPPKRKPAVRDAPVLSAEMRAVIDTWLLDDQKAPRKQRHTARRIHRRLTREHGFDGAESTVRRHVGRRRRELGVVRDVCVPQHHPPGMEAEADWYEAYVDLPVGRTKVYVLAVRACYSGREFHVAYWRLTQQAFLEGLALAFEWFGGVFHLVRLDNLTLAVKRVLKGRKRLETDRFVALRSHYIFDSAFCLVGEQGAHEKGGVEGGLGRHRRNHLVPVPQVKDLEALNRLLRGTCAEDDHRKLEDRQRTVIEDWADEAPHLRALPKERFDTAEVAPCRVDSKSRVKVRTNHYSVPVRLSGRKVEVRVLAQRVIVVHDGRTVADHDRLHVQHGERLCLDHYLELLKFKPGALPNARPLRQARDRDEWPPAYDHLWSRFRDRHGDADGTRQLVDVLMLLRAHAPGDVHLAVEMAVDLGCSDAGAVAVLLRQLLVADETSKPLRLEGPLSAHGTPASDDFSAYDALLAGASP
jgi:hypothetical protein